MTTHSHELTSHRDHHPTAHRDASAAEPRPTRPRWLVPALVAGAVIAVLLISGVLSPSFLLYGGLLAGCGLMHLFGHGGHGGYDGGSSPTGPK